MPFQRATVWGGIAVACGLLAGCSDDGLALVEGTVTVDGQPVVSGAITFVPADGGAPTAGGMITDGRYRVRVPPGVMKVSISVPKVVGKKKIYPTENSPEMPVTIEALPAKYNERTELQMEVKPGKNEKNFPLKNNS